MATPNKPTDEELMLSYKSGDSRAFEQLYLRHKGGLYRYILRSCESKAIAEELFQDAWTSLIRARKSYQPSALFTTWLYKIASNQLTDHYRKTGKWDQIVEDVNKDNDNCAVAAPYEQPEHQADNNQQIKRLLLCIEQLPALQRQVFLLKEEAGLKLEEIAKSIESNKEAVKSRMRYAIQKLRLCMQAET
ncbi:MAG: RNA polymerase sigma factor [Mariprofundaceae bacterium]